MGKLWLLVLSYNTPFKFSEYSRVSFGVIFLGICPFLWSFLINWLKTIHNFVFDLLKSSGYIMPSSPPLSPTFFSAPCFWLFYDIFSWSLSFKIYPFLFLINKFCLCSPLTTLLFASFFIFQVSSKLRCSCKWTSNLTINETSCISANTFNTEFFSMYYFSCIL